MKWKNKEREWVVIVSCLVKEEPKEGKPEAFKIVDAGRVEKATSPEYACLKALSNIWVEAAKRKEIQPICGVRAVTKVEFDKALAATKQEATPNDEKKKAEATSEASGQTETKEGNTDPLGEQAGGTGVV